MGNAEPITAAVPQPWTERSALAAGHRTSRRVRGRGQPRASPRDGGSRTARPGPRPRPGGRRRAGRLPRWAAPPPPSAWQARSA
ncbi:hypothetical protein SNL152K_992 [Streptomyces sp. NL15-2K]|nr:hypothetical protein SNL152K_992 [Streptomyces sp. NL15-2K]